MGQSAEETKFILLDMRDEEDYLKCHIREAINFPAPNISRDGAFGLLLRFKNQADKVIVVYMDDERQGTHHARLLFEKGFDNVSLLTGGFEQFCTTDAICHAMLEGDQLPPVPKLAVRPQSAAMTLKSSASRSSFYSRLK